MQYNAIYKNGKPERFFLRLDDEKERAIVALYFLESAKKGPRVGRINQMAWVFTDVLSGKQRHGAGYSSAADVFGTFRMLILGRAGSALSESVRDEVFSMNTHDDVVRLSKRALDEIESAIRV